MLTGDERIALIHDELTRRGGAEIVFEELVRMFPQADLYTLYAGKPVIRSGEHLKPVQTSYLQNFPLWFRRHPGRMLPLLPHAAEQFDFSGYDAVISSSSGFAKAIITRANVPHICYCHAPTRYLWDMAAEAVATRPRMARWPLRVLQHYLRLVDFTAAQRVDIFLANSRFTHRRIHSYYRRGSEVVYPPIDTAFFTPAMKQGKDPDAPFLLVGRLTRAKHFDAAIRVCEKLHLPLVVVGRGQDEARLKRIKHKYTRFLGAVSPEELRSQYRSARAVLQPGIEDFGMTAAEALACGTPVIAFAYGGAAEIIRSGETGILYSQPGEEGLAEAMRLFLSGAHEFLPEHLQKSVLKFSRVAFQKNIYSQLTRTLESKQ